MNIRNTTEDMHDPVNALAFIAEATVDGTSAPIERMEADGQRQLVNSDRLPTKIQGERAEFEAFGFTFGDPDPNDPLFMPATLPAGWTRKATDHDMWSNILDELGRPRVSIGYKAAFYDRWALMRLNTVIGYVRDCLWTKAPFVTDDTWATPAAVADALRECITDAQERIAEILQLPGTNDDYWLKRRGEHADEITTIQARLDEFTASLESSDQ